MPEFKTQPLSPATWDAYAALVERHGGVWGGCWCMEFHPDGKQRGPQRRALKEALVREGQAHAALVFDGDACVGWCQYGPAPELPRIKHLRVYTQGLEVSPDWRITCFFVDKAFRGQGVAALALSAALQQIAGLGGGSVESYPEDVEGHKVSASFLYNSRLAMFENQGFARLRPLGKHHWVVGKTVASDV